jgi:hypothetical protein
VRNKRVIIAVVFLIGAVVLGAFVIAPALQQRAKARMIENLSRICDLEGASVPKVATYERTSGVHPAIHFTKFTGFVVSPYADLARWEPENLRDVELVICLEEARGETVEICQYDKGSVPRFYTQMKVTVFEARTGILVATKTFTGDLPRECQQTEWVRTEIAGAYPDSNTIEEWLKQYTELP